MSSLPRIDRVILGTNPLAGVDHVMASRGLERSQLISDQQVIDVIRSAVKAGARGISFDSGSRLESLAYKALTGISATDVGTYPIIPDSTIVPAVLNRGTAAAASEAIRGVSWVGKARAIASGGWSVLTGDILGALESYLGVAVEQCRRRAGDKKRVRALVLHELATDAIVGLSAREVLQTYVSSLGETHHIWPGFVTRNLPQFVELCNGSDVALKNVLVMTPWNPIGFQMTPSRTACEKTVLGLGDAHILAVSMLAGGQVSINSGIEYLRKFSRLEGAVVGASSSDHATSTFGRLSKELPQ